GARPRAGTARNCHRRGLGGARLALFMDPVGVAFAVTGFAARQSAGDGLHQHGLAVVEQLGPVGVGLVLVVAAGEVAGVDLAVLDLLNGDDAGGAGFAVGAGDGVVAQDVHAVALLEETEL